MTALKTTIMYGVLTLAAMTLLFLMLQGCSRQSTDTTAYTPYPEMPERLQALQGTWTDINTNDAVECAVVIQGYTIRVRYHSAADELLQKYNASIDRLDEEQSVLILNGGTGAWPCQLTEVDEQETLKLDFFGTDGWHEMLLRRTD